MSVLFERFRPTFENNLLIRGKYFKDLLDGTSEVDKISNLNGLMPNI